MIDLKPCRCGETDVVLGRDDTFIDGVLHRGKWHVFCRGCRTEFGRFDSEEEAIEAWNTRLAERTCHNADNDGIWFECSECGEYLTVEFFGSGYGTPNYCPCCGAKVVEE